MQTPYKTILGPSMARIDSQPPPPQQLIKIHTKYLHNPNYDVYFVLNGTQFRAA